MYQKRDYAGAYASEFVSEWESELQDACLKRLPEEALPLAKANKHNHPIR
jgi:hypothetical protein